MISLGGIAFVVDNPPVKNQRFLPAPFTQGGLSGLYLMRQSLKIANLVSFRPSAARGGIFGPLLEGAGTAIAVTGGVCSL